MLPEVVRASILAMGRAGGDWEQKNIIPNLTLCNSPLPHAIKLQELCLP